MDIHSRGRRPLMPFPPFPRPVRLKSRNLLAARRVAVNRLDILRGAVHFTSAWNLEAGLRL